MANHWIDNKKSPPRPTLDPDLSIEIKRLADANRWNFTTACEVLLEEALAARGVGVADQQKQA